MKRLPNSLVVGLIPSLVIAAALIVPSASGHSRPLPPLAASGEVVVYDTWYGTSFRRNYTRCDAVANVYVRGVYDVQQEPDGVAIALGLTNEGQSLEITVDGTHHGCFGLRPARH